ncbi:pB117L [African swine fever virus]|uniref:PB117L n=1 Tax=African swine fever virus TaxID=10497 RepID=A0A2Z5DFH6_ASF|nr:pB117L [African swine fever virus]AXB49486.1 pB117L [African swine fever virus]AXB49658.1 pB117L [African swine fever virus]AXB49829.1 pB117L [African swine fever virus]AXB50002.1 pB117L [African swine fever virus]
MGYTIQLDKDGDYYWDDDSTHHDPYMRANAAPHAAAFNATAPHTAAFNAAAPHAAAFNTAAHHAFHEPFIKLNLTDKNIFNGLGFILIVIFIYLLLITLQQMLTRHIYNTVQHCVKAHLDSKNLQ